MRLNPAQRLATEQRIRQVMDHLLGGDIPPGGRCDIAALARQALLTEQAREFQQFNG